MRDLRPAVLIVAGLLLASTAVSADEIVRFHDGRFLKVKGFSTTDRTIRFDFAGGAFVMIPTRRVDIIDRDGRIVFVGPRQEDDSKSMVAEGKTPARDARDSDLVVDRRVGDRRSPEGL
jgi:hypothetical protein